MNMLRLLIACDIIALAFGWPRINITKRSVPASGSNVKWTSSHSDSTRRLDFQMTNSHSDTSNADCIVGGYDEDNPLEIYVGGPCTGLTVNGDDVAVTEDFRWIVMRTEHMDVTDGTTSAEMRFLEGSGFVKTKEETTHAEVAVGGSQVVQVDGMDHAAMYACTTSYLAKDTFEYNKNSFAYGSGDDERSEQCVVPCCADPGGTWCTCSSCPDEMTQASPGMYKYSIMVAAYDLSGATSGADGNGWERVVETYGQETAGEKVLSGYVDIFQSFDFTNMQTDALTVIKPDGSEVTYSNMGTCDFTDGTGCEANAVEIASVKVESGDWTGIYDFPQTYNGGSFTAATINSPTVEGTNNVEMHCMKPTDANLASWNLANHKWVLVRYRFDVTGLTAGKFFNYDPTVVSDPSVSASTPAPPGASTPAPTVNGAVGTASGALQPGRDVAQIGVLLAAVLSSVVGQSGL